MRQSNTKRGVYILGNDNMLTLLIACIESIRCTNPDLPICFVPFDDHCTHSIAIATATRCLVWPSRSLLHRCDEVASRFFGGTSPGQFRKLALWDGPFDMFIYIDIDTVLLSRVDFIFTLLTSFDYIASHSNVPSTRRFVWKTPEVPGLTDAQISFSANTGFFCSHKAALTLSTIERATNEALNLKDYMELICSEQPFLNWLIVTMVPRHTSLLDLVIQRKGSYPLEVWGGNVRLRHDKEIDLTRYRHGVLLVHWAGVWRESVHKSLPLWNRLLSDGCTRVKPFYSCLPESVCPIDIGHHE